jgi:hypothetical protein
MWGVASQVRWPVFSPEPRWSQSVDRPHPNHLFRRRPGGMPPNLLTLPASRPWRLLIFPQTCVTRDVIYRASCGGELSFGHVCVVLLGPQVDRLKDQYHREGSGMRSVGSSNSHGSSHMSRTSYTGNAGGGGKTRGCGLWGRMPPMGRSLPRGAPSHGRASCRMLSCVVGHGRHAHSGRSLSSHWSFLQVPTPLTPCFPKGTAAVLALTPSRAYRPSELVPRLAVTVPSMCWQLSSFALRPPSPQRA